MDHVTIIAEAGVNHNGDLQIAKRLIDVAADAGADYVKFQTFQADKLVSKDTGKAEYQKKNIGDGNAPQYDMLKKLELTKSQHYELRDYSKQHRIKFLSTAFDLESIGFLDALGVDVFKIPSGEITNLPYLMAIAKMNKPVIISTGMATMEEVVEAVKVLTMHGVNLKKITVLHCNTEYPTPFEDVNLHAMNYIGEKLNVKIGYSDHTTGVEIPMAAVALGATVIEKHFTLDRSLPGPDHAASLEPKELKAMVCAIRNIEKALMGSGIKEPSNSEIKNRAVARKSIFAAVKLTAGSRISENDLIMLRPGTGISPMDIKKVIGKQLVKNIESGEMLTWGHLQ
jgi:N-acetylneuraminate synthase